MKAFKDNTFDVHVVQIVQFFSQRVENIVGKGENAGYQLFLLFPQCFLKALSPKVIYSFYCIIMS